MRATGPAVVASYFLAGLLMTVALSGCMTMASERMTGHMKAAMLGQDDPETVRAAAPAFLLLTESMIAESPDDPDLLMAGAELSSAYAALLFDPERRRRLSNRAFDYASRGLCVSYATICETREGSFDDFTAALAVRRFVVDFFFGASAVSAALAVFTAFFVPFLAAFFFGGPAAARAASSSSASSNVNSSTDVPLGTEAFVVPSVT